MPYLRKDTCNQVKWVWREGGGVLCSETNVCDNVFGKFAFAWVAGNGVGVLVGVLGHGDDHAQSVSSCGCVFVDVRCVEMNP